MKEALNNEPPTATGAVQPPSPETMIKESMIARTAVRGGAGRAGTVGVEAGALVSGAGCRAGVGCPGDLERWIRNAAAPSNAPTATPPIASLTPIAIRRRGPRRLAVERAGIRPGLRGFGLCGPRPSGDPALANPLVTRDPARRIEQDPRGLVGGSHLLRGDGLRRARHVGEAVAVVQFVVRALGPGDLLVGGAGFEAERLVMHRKIDVSHADEGTIDQRYGRNRTAASARARP